MASNPGADTIPRVGDSLIFPEWKGKQSGLPKRCWRWTVRGYVDGLVVVRRRVKLGEAGARIGRGTASWVYEVWRPWNWWHWKDWKVEE